jgi:nitroreductase
MTETDLFEVMYSAGSIRRFRSDPVPDEIITKILDAAIRAPSGSNAQSWVFIVVKDSETRRRLGNVYRNAASILMQLYSGLPRPGHMDERKYERFMAAVMHLFEHMGEAPVLLVPCLKASLWTSASNLPADLKARLSNAARIAGSSIYPAVQNVILACRAFGLGTVLTTIHTFFEDEVREILTP